ncbi:hypothetical protein BC937DRAFT_88064 [Endogone sp. FLAS-F59071]|nr:hypothetical protein BC937DRAFT_88064 [Endogone sp. FLAS-F59071]|eukprot:RUS19022.1 hypothetical protein BC937DRAFT_88064 [Endogone sp. FLAS-F59071]
MTKDSTAVTAANATNLEPEIAAYRLSQVLTAITSFDKNTPQDVKEQELVELLVLAHHPLIVSPTDKYDWITLAQRAGANPGKLVETYGNRMKELILDGIRDGYEVNILRVSNNSRGRDDEHLQHFMNILVIAQMRINSLTPNAF